MPDIPVRKDALVIGGGPSGSRVAYSLAELGYEVLVLDRKQAPGDRVCCTGIVSVECLDRFGIDRKLILRPARSARFVPPSGNWLRFWRDDEVAYVLDRPALDRALVCEAQQAGASYIFDAKVRGIELADRCVRVAAACRGETRTYEAAIAVVATGFGSSLIRKLGLTGIDRFVVGAQAKVETNGFDEIEIYLDQTLAPGGFAWLVPGANGAGLAGLLTGRNPEPALKSFLARLQSTGRIQSVKDTGYGAIPTRPIAKSCTDRVLVVGEAAGQVKVNTGGGIYYGLICADLAADCLHQAFVSGDFSQARLSAYERQWRNKLGADLRTGYWLRSLYGRLDNHDIERLFDIMRSRDFPGFVAQLETFSFDWHRPLAAAVLRHLAASVPLWTAKTLLSRMLVPI